MLKSIPIIRTELFFCYMLHAQNLSYIHILYTQMGVYIIYEYKKNIERYDNISLSQNTPFSIIQ